jgi:hypothetical protein
MSMAMRVDGARGAGVSAAELMPGGFGEVIADRASAGTVIVGLCRVWTAL